MGRILAIDYGQKRVGLAVTDVLRMIAAPLATVHSKDVMEFLKEYCAKEPVDLFVVGEPKQMDNTPSESERFIIPFISTLRKYFPGIPVARMDERFTSRIAARTLLEGGVKKEGRRNKELLDKISASLILQSYLESMMWNQQNS